MVQTKQLLAAAAPVPPRGVRPPLHPSAALLFDRLSAALSILRLRLGVGTYLKVEGQDDLLGVQEELEQRYQAPVKLGGIERRIARRRWDELPLFHARGGIGVVRPEAGWRLG